MVNTNSLKPVLQGNDVFIHRYHTEFDEAVDTIDPGYSLAFFIAEAMG